MGSVYNIDSLSRLHFRSFLQSSNNHVDNQSSLF